MATLILWKHKKQNKKDKKSWVGNRLGEDEEEEEKDEQIKVVDTLAALPDWMMTLNLLIHPPLSPPSFLTHIAVWPPSSTFFILLQDNSVFNVIPNVTQTRW